MADFIDSNLFQPTAPSEYLLKKPRRKKLKVDEGHLRRNKKVLQAMGPAEGRGMTALGTKQRRAGNTDQNHSPTRGGVTMNGTEEVPDSQCQNHTDDGSSSLGLPSEGEQEKLTTCHKTESVAASPTISQEDSSPTSPARPNSLSEEPPNSTLPNDLDALQNLPDPAEEVLPKAPSPKQKPDSEESPVSQETQDESSQDQPTDDDNAAPDPPPSSTLVELETPDIHCNGRVDDLTDQSKLVNVSDIQEQFTKLNLKRCGKDAALHSNTTCDVVTANSGPDSGSEEPAAVEPEPGQVTTVPPVPPEADTTAPQTTDNCPVIDVLVTPPETQSKPPSEVVFLPFHEDNEMRSFNKRKRILRLLQYLFKIRRKRQGKTEDKQVLIEEEMLAEEEEGSGQGEVRVARHKKTKRALSHHPADLTNTADPAKKRRRPRKKVTDSCSIMLSLIFPLRLPMWRG